MAVVIALLPSCCCVSCSALFAIPCDGSLPLIYFCNVVLPPRIHNFVRHIRIDMIFSSLCVAAGDALPPLKTCSSACFVWPFLLLALLASRPRDPLVPDTSVRLQPSFCTDAPSRCLPRLSPWTVRQGTRQIHAQLNAGGELATSRLACYPALHCPAPTLPYNSPLCNDPAKNLTRTSPRNYSVGQQ